MEKNSNSTQDGPDTTRTSSASSSEATAIATANADASSTADAKTKLGADVQKNAPRVVKHMNDDHGDSLLAYVLAFATGVENSSSDDDVDDHQLLLRQVLNGTRTMDSAKLTGIDVDGFLLEIVVVAVRSDGGADHLVLSNVRVPYDRPLQNARDLHAIAVAMHRKAYDKLGMWYKARNGYYQQVFKMVAFATYKSVRKQVRTRTPTPTRNRTAAVVGLTAAAAGAGCYYYYFFHRLSSVSDGNKGVASSTVAAAAAVEPLIRRPNDASSKY